MFFGRKGTGRISACKCVDAYWHAINHYMSYKSVCARMCSVPVFACASHHPCVRERAVQTIITIVRRPRLPPFPSLPKTRVRGRGPAQARRGSGTTGISPRPQPTCQPFCVHCRPAWRWQYDGHHSGLHVRCYAQPNNNSLKPVLFELWAQVHATRSLLLFAVIQTSFEHHHSINHYIITRDMINSSCPSSPLSCCLVRACDASVCTWVLWLQGSTD